MDQSAPTAVMENMRSPTLEALCHDLDMFINELTVNSVSNRSSSSVNETRNYNHKEITPLELDKSMVCSFKQIKNYVYINQLATEELPR